MSTSGSITVPSAIITVGFFCKIPELRKSLHATENPIGRAALVKMVKTYKAEKLNQTQIVRPVFNQSQKYKLRFSQLAMCASMFLGLIPTSNSMIRYLPAQIEVRTREWVKITLNGQMQGFSPLSLKNLHPGIYIMDWHTKTQSGQITINLRAGETLLLNDSNLRRPATD